MGRFLLPRRQKGKEGSEGSSREKRKEVGIDEGKICFACFLLPFPALRSFDRLWIPPDRRFLHVFDISERSGLTERERGSVGRTIFRSSVLLSSFRSAASAGNGRTEREERNFVITKLLWGREKARRRSWQNSLPTSETRNKSRSSSSASSSTSFKPSPLSPSISSLS